MEAYSVNVASVASGTDKTLANIFNPAASPVTRGGVYHVTVGAGVATPDDQSAQFVVARTTAVGTEGSGLTPLKQDPGGPAGAYDSGLGVYTVEPTYSDVMLRFTCHHRFTYQWYANEGRELKMAATQNNGAGLKTTGSTSTQAYGGTILFLE